MGSFLQAGYGVTQALLKPEEITDAVGFMSFGIHLSIAFQVPSLSFSSYLEVCGNVNSTGEHLGQSMGIVISLAIAGTIFQNRAVSNVVSILPSVDTSSLHSAITGTDSA